jgi:hypothetical protein
MTPRFRKEIEAILSDDHFVSVAIEVCLSNLDSSRMMRTEMKFAADIKNGTIYTSELVREYI